MNLKKGMAGLILLVLVIGYMMTISMSSSMMIQTESSGKFARRGYKNAYYAAVAGIGMTMARLRQTPAVTFAALEKDRQYFAISSSDAVAHDCTWDTDKTHHSDSSLIGPGWVVVNTPFVTNTQVETDRYLTRICSYPGVEPGTGNPVYYVKCQGKYIDSLGDNEFFAQVWAKFKINAPAKLLALDSFGTMSVQGLTNVNNTPDFWDWENNFQ